MLEKKDNSTRNVFILFAGLFVCIVCGSLVLALNGVGNEDDENVTTGINTEIPVDTNPSSPLLRTPTRPRPTATRPPSNSRSNCSSSYPDVYIPPPPPDLDCKDIPYHNFKVLPPDPHNFDGDGNGIGCEN